MKEINDKIPQSPKGQCLSATILRAAGAGVRHEIAEMFCRFERLKIHTAGMIQRVQSRTDHQNKVVCQLLDEIKTNAITDVNEAVALYKTIDSDQRRWVSEHDWRNYEDGVATNAFRVNKIKAPVPKMPNLRTLKKEWTPPYKRKKNSVLHNASKPDASVSVVREARRLTRSLKSLDLRSRADKALGQVQSFCKDAKTVVVKDNRRVPDKEFLQWAENEVQLNKNPKTAYTTIKQCMLNIADVFEERGSF